MTFSIQKERLTAHSLEGLPMGYITFPRVKAGLVNIDHVMTYPKFRGQGVAGAMMEQLLRHLTESGHKAALTCPFAQEYVRKNPQWSHILPGKLHFTSH